MNHNEIPSDREVVEALAHLGEGVSARLLCDKLVSAGHPLRKSQLAIQRAAERGLVRINADWTLTAVMDEAAAA